MDQKLGAEQLSDTNRLDRRSALRQILDFIFGYDFFISYAWTDGSTYAAALSSRLQSQGFEVFLDRSNYASGDDWKQVGAWTLRRTSQLVLVGSPAALHSEPVIREVEIFSGTRRRIVPIDFGGSLDWRQSVSRLENSLPLQILRIRELAAALNSGPSDETVARIQQTFDLVSSCPQTPLRAPLDLQRTLCNDPSKRQIARPDLVPNGSRTAYPARPDLRISGADDTAGSLTGRINSAAGLRKFSSHLALSQALLT